MDPRIFKGSILVRRVKRCLIRLTFSSLVKYSHIGIAEEYTIVVDTQINKHTFKIFILFFFFLLLLRVRKHFNRITMLVRTVRQQYQQWGENGISPPYILGQAMTSLIHNKHSQLRSGRRDGRKQLYIWQTSIVHCQKGVRDSPAFF